jgi:hypothetical protein
MTFGFMVFLFGAILVAAGLRHQSIQDVISGAPPPDDPLRPEDDPQLAALLQPGESPGQLGKDAGQLTDLSVATLNGAWGGSKDVVDVAVNIGRRNGLKVTSTKRATKNTASGNTSDHWVGNKTAYAADQSNGSSPTPEMDRTAKEIAQAFGISWSGSGLAQTTVTVAGKRFRVQLIYRSMIGGNHYNHVHFGARLVG